jgi:hypothetical protein
MKSRIQKKPTKTWPSLVNMVKSGKAKVKRDPIETLQGLIDMGATECTLTRDEAQYLIDKFNKLQGFLSKL